MEPPDENLMQAVRDGDAHALDELVRRHREPVRRRLARMVRDEAAADDLAQEVFLRVWTRADQWQGRGAVSAWLTRIAVNLALNHMRTVRRRRELPLETPTGPEDEEVYAPNWMIDASALGPDALAEEIERRERLQRLVDGLPEEKREVFRLVREMEMDIRSASQTLGIPEGTAKSRLHFAAKRLAKEWRDMNGEDE